MESSYRIEKSDSKVHWDEFVLEHGGHPLQLWGWGDLKATYAWDVERFFIIEDDTTIGAVQLLIRKLPKPFGQLLYVPRGPVVVGDKQLAVYEQLIAYVQRSHKAVALTIEPGGTHQPTGEGWIPSPNAILTAETVVLDLTRPEGSLRASMNQSARDRLREATSHSLTLRRIGNPDDITECLEIYKEVAARNRFNLHKDQYYYDLQNKLGENSCIFGCYEEGVLVGYIWLALSESVAFELFSASNARGEDLKAIDALRWEAIRRTKQWGIEHYDTNAADDTFESFSTNTFTHAGTFDLPLSSTYKLWRWALRMRLKQTPRHS